MSEDQKMGIGVALPNYTWPSGEVWSAARIMDFAIRAERLGFDSVWLPDHIFFEGWDMGFGDRRTIACPEPLILLANLAARTTTIKLGTLVLSARTRHPAQLAREARTLAEISDGRFILGVGAGWQGTELESWGLEPGHSYSRFSEYLDVLVPLLDGERLDYDGRFFTTVDTEVPGSTRPPLMVAAHGPKGVKLAAAVGDAWNGDGPDGESLRKVLAEEEVAAGRAAGSVMPTTSITTLMVAEEDADRVLAEHPPVFGPPIVGAAALRAAVAERRAAGYGDLFIHFGAGLFYCHSEDELDNAAAALELVPVSS